jgi:Protein of unknown function (DUF998)
MSLVSSPERGQRPATPATAATVGSVVGRTAAWLSLITSALFLALLAALHLITPELDPAWRMISEYAIGRHGWVMAAAFFALTASYIGLAGALAAHVKTVGGWLGLALLVVSAVGTAIAGVYPTDPITISPDAVSSSGQMHGLGAMLGIPTFPFAASLITWGLWRSPAWASARRTLLLAVGLVWLGLGVFVLAMATQFRGSFGPDVVIGWQNRLLIVAYTAWVIVAAWQANKQSQQSVA